MVGRTRIRFVGVPAGGLHGLTPWRAARNAVKLARGWWAAYRLGRRERPAALFATGGYASIPVALAAWTLRVPILVYLPDIEPGLAVRFIGRLASRVAVTVGDSRPYFSDSKVVVTGYPVRSEFQGLDRAEARTSLGLTSSEPVVLVMGGSHGARSINRALGKTLESVLELAQVVHLSGNLDWPWVMERQKALPAGLKKRYHAYPYLHGRMGYALSAADLAVCRAGASILGELPFFGLPAVLVPYPYAWRYQQVNASWLAGRGAAVILRDERLDQQLFLTIQQLLADEKRLMRMRERVQALAQPDAAARLAAELRAMAVEDAEEGARWFPYTPFS